MSTDLLIYTAWKWILLTSIWQPPLKNLCLCTQLYAGYMSKNCFTSLTGAILPKVKDGLLWANRKKRLYSSAPKCRVFILFITTKYRLAFGWYLSYANGLLCGAKLISYHFIWLTTVSERWALCVCVCYHLESCVVVTHQPSTKWFTMQIGFYRWEKTIQIFAQCLDGKLLPGSGKQLQKLFSKWIGMER